MAWDDDPSENLESWLEHYLGCIGCGCDHGCNQWLQKNQTKSLLIMRVLIKRGNTDLNELVRRPNSEVNSLFWKLGLRYHSIRFSEAKYLDSIGSMYDWNTGALRWHRKSK